MIDFIDRSVEHANRYRTIPVPGTNDIVDLVAAPGEVSEEGTFINKRASQLLQADRRYYPAKEPITAGDVVDVVGGEVGKRVEAGPNTTTMFIEYVTTATAVTKLSDKYSVVCCTCYPSNQTTSINKLTVLLDDTGKSVGAANFYETGNVGVTNLTLARLSDTKFVVGYAVSNVFYAKVGTVSGTTITFGSQYTLSTVTTYYSALIAWDENSFLAIYNRSGLKAKVFPVSGTAITTAAAEFPLSGNTVSHYISATRLPDLNGNKRVCVCFADGSDDNKGKAVIATIKADNTVEFGAVATFEEAVTYTSCASDSLGDVYIAYRTRSPNGRYVRFLSVNAATIIPESTRLGNIWSLTENVFTPITSVGKKIILVDNVYVKEVWWDGSYHSGAEFRFAPSGTPLYCATSAINANHIIISYSSAGTNGTATILEIHNDQIAGSFTDVSRDCIALADAAQGQPCEVIFDGVAELPGLTAGEEINSDGVYGYCPQDGWVWVRASWDADKVVTGSYMGTGTYGENSPVVLRFPFNPKLVVIQSENALSSYQGLGGMALYGCKYIKPWMNYASTSSGRDGYITWRENEVSIFSTYSEYGQFNAIGKYRYFAIG